MVYNDLKEKVKAFLKPFADSGEPVGAEDIKTYFEKLRGDAEGVKAANVAATVAGVSGGGAGRGDGAGDDGDQRREQDGMSSPSLFLFLIKSPLGGKRG